MTPADKATPADTSSSRSKHAHADRSRANRGQSARDRLKSTGSTRAPSRHAQSKHAERRHHRSFPLIVANLAIVMVFAGGAAAYGALSNTATLTVDGRTDTVRIFGDTVGDVLTAKNVTLHEGDRINHPVSAKVSDGDDIVVSYAKPVTLTLDGVVTQHTIYDRTVGQAFDTLGIAPDAGAYLSAKATSRIPRSGAKLIVSSTKKLTVVADGEKKTLTTSAPTVDAVLSQAGITLDGDDEVNPGTDAYVQADQKLRVVRIKKVDKTETVSVDYETTVKKDSDAMQGEETVVKDGESGKNRQRVTLVYADGKLRKRIVLSTDVVKKPVTKVVSRGTATTPPDSVWDKIAQCESGGNWSINTGNGYYGGLQFSAATWHSVGGTGLPSEHSREEQIKRAKILQARSGWGQWGCAGARFN